jgi:CBS domain-containing protein
MRVILKHLLQTRDQPKELQPEHATAKDIMITNPITVGPNTTILEAMSIMLQSKIGCLPVVQNDELIGIITEMDFLRISGRLIERLEG